MSDTLSPERQAYQSALQQGYHGRFAANIANIRLFKNNPYIADLDEADRIELNKNLLAPFNGELFYDDEKFIYVCNIVKDPISGELSYIYTSTGKQSFDKLKYYESKGVMNQLLSAYQNGKVYKFYFSPSSLMMFPNSDLVFPAEYDSYTVSLQGLNGANQKVYVAGNYEDGRVTDVHIGMKVIQDAMNNTSYTRMGAAKIFATSNPNNQMDVIQNGFFYVIDFYDEHGEVVDTKLFQAVEAASYDTQVPSATVEDLKIVVHRNNAEAKSASNIYSIYAGEDLTKTISYSVIAVYSDGTEKIITSMLDGPQLSREGWDANTTGAAEGDKFKVKFTYWSQVDETGTPIGSSISKSVYFQVVSNTYSKLAKCIPVVWMDNASDFNINSSNGTKTYKLKVYTLDVDGVLENKTRSFYDSKKVVKSGEILGNWETCPVTFDPYQQCCVFVFPPFAETTLTTFEFGMYNDGELKKYRFNVDFGGDITANKGMFVNAWNNNVNDFGYGPSGILETLANTFYVDSQTGAYNKATVNNNTEGEGYKIQIRTNQNDLSLKELYSRTINGYKYSPTRIQLFAVKDSTVTALSDAYQYADTAKTVDVPLYNDEAVKSIVQNIMSYDFILAKFINVTQSGNMLVNFDLFNAVRNF